MTCDETCVVSECRTTLTVGGGGGKHYDVDREAGDAWALAGRLFDAVDDNGDGELSWAELHEYLSGPQVNLKPKDCDELFKTLDSNSDGAISKFEFATGFEKFRAGVVLLKDAEMDKMLERQRRAEHMQATKTSGTKTGSAVVSRSVPKASSSGSRRDSEDGGGTSRAGAAGGGSVRKVASPTVTHVRSKSASLSSSSSSTSSPFVYEELTEGIRVRQQQERRLHSYVRAVAPVIAGARAEVERAAKSGDRAATERARARFATLAARVQSESAALTWGSADGEEARAKFVERYGRGGEHCMQPAETLLYSACLRM